ncbi:MAG TPA: endonuclease/exonuclease/phosphatase family protein [Blastocatellia bacterium]|nr:endonuclease/exonuclease/phosphatase family protein [Blastocatellia bacterium]
MIEDTHTNLSADNQHLVNELLRFSSFEELRNSAIYGARAPELRRLLDEPRVYRASSPSPRLRSFLRVVEWNIERGSRLEGIIEVLNRHHVLSFADVLLINEVDEGMARSGNVNVALELSRALSAHAVFGVEYLELTKGAGDERKLAGENTTALHGNAFLTRYDLFEPQIVQLPRCENNFESTERRLGGRIGILVDLEIAGRRLCVGNTHLDVVNTPRCRGRQMRAFLQAADARFGNQPAIVGGDLNTHTFARGTRLRAMKNTATILASRPHRLRGRLSRPETREPAVRELTRFGFEISGYNDRSATSRSIVSNLDDPTRLPRPMKWWVNRRIGPEGLLLEFRLDWLAGRGLRALRAGEMVDKETGVASVDPRTFQGLTHNGSPISDHDPIVVDVALETNQQ